MGHDQDDNLRVIESSDGIRIDLPPRPTYVDLKSPLRADRIAAWLSLVFLVLLTGAMVAVASAGIKYLHKLLPPRDAVDKLSMYLLGLGALLYVGWAIMLALAALAFFTEHISLAIDASQVTESRRRGPWRRTRCIGFASIRRLMITAPMRSSARRLRQPLDEQSARVILETANDVICLGGELPRPAACRLAQEVSRHLNKHRPAETAVPIIDAMHPAWLNSNLAERPTESDMRIEALPDGLHVDYPRQSFSFKALLKDNDNRATLWILLAPLFLCVPGLWLPSELPDVRHALRVVMLGFSVFGAFCGALIAYGSSLGVSFRTNPEFLEITYKFLLYRKRRRWSRAEIVAIRVVQGAGNAERTRYILQLLEKNGHQTQVISHSVLEVRYLGAVLRDALNIPAEPHDSMPLAPSDPAWHLQDQPLAPSDCPFTSATRGDRVVIHKPAKGFANVARGSLLVWACFVIVCIAGMFLMRRHITNTDDRALMVFFVVCILCVFSLLMVLAVIADARDEYIFSALPESLSLTHRRMFRMRHRQWNRDDLASISTELQFPNNPRSAARLVISLHDGTSYKITGKPEAMRHLATLLRRALSVGALSFDARVPSPV